MLKIVKHLMYMADILNRIRSCSNTLHYAHFQFQKNWQNFPVFVIVKLNIFLKVNNAENNLHALKFTLKNYIKSI